jgi:hypothetical protein
MSGGGGGWRKKIKYFAIPDNDDAPSIDKKKKGGEEVATPMRKKIDQRSLFFEEFGTRTCISLALLPIYTTFNFLP